MFGYVSYTREHEGAQAADFIAAADFTDETAAENPDWTLDLSDQEIGHWRGTEGRRGVITLVWGVALVPNGVVATAELGPDDHRPVRARGGPLHARVARRLHGRLRRGPPLRRARSRAGPRVAVRGRVAQFTPYGRRFADSAACCSSSASSRSRAATGRCFVNALERNLRRLTADLGPLEVRHRGGVFIVTGTPRRGRAGRALPRAARRERRAAARCAASATPPRRPTPRSRCCAAAPGAPSPSAPRGATSASRSAPSSSRG